MQRNQLTQRRERKEGLNNPPINELEKMAGCRYRLVSAVAKRARGLMDENKKRDDSINRDIKPRISDNESLDKAIDEFYNGDYVVAGSETVND